MKQGPSIAPDNVGHFRFWVLEATRNVSLPYSSISDLLVHVPINMHLPRQKKQPGVIQKTMVQLGETLLHGQPFELKWSDSRCGLTGLNAEYMAWSFVGEVHEGGHAAVWLVLVYLFELSDIYIEGLVHVRR